MSTTSRSNGATSSRGISLSGSMRSCAPRFCGCFNRRPMHGILPRQEAAMKTRLTERCEYPDCKKKPTTFAAGRRTPVGCYCDDHADVISNKDSPEYTTGCPNCGCEFGVN